MFDPIEFFSLAISLASNRDSEASLRTAIGRAYYASFLTARQKLRIHQRRRVHKVVIGALRKRDRTAGDQLDKLEELRGIADYELSTRDPSRADWQWNWGLAYNYATDVLRRIERLS